MTATLIGTPPSAEALRQDLEGYLRQLEAHPSQQVFVTFGFAWGNYIYAGDWLELCLTGSELRKRLGEAEAEELGRIGRDDLHIRDPKGSVERLYCHHGDVHLSVADAQSALLLEQRQSWLELGWDVRLHDED